MVHSSARLAAYRNRIAEARVRMPGTCGELVQGAIDGVPFHVSCPIDVFATVTVRITNATDEWIFPSGFPKAAAAIKAALEYFGQTGLGGSVTIDSGLPRAKGMASSTADVAGAVHALALALDKEISPAEVARLALQVEPSDGSMFPDIALFDHRYGGIYENLGSPPPLDIIVLDFGGEVDTLAFNSRDRTDLLAEIEPIAAEALALARRGLHDGDLSLLGQAATLSAQANQAILYKPELDRVLSLAKAVGAVGVNVGHSGTVLGVLLDRSLGTASQAAAFIADELPELERLSVCRLIGGGYRHG